MKINLLSSTVAIFFFLTAGCSPLNSSSSTAKASNDTATLGNLGVDYAEKGEFDKAIKQFTAVIRIEPHNADAYYNRGAAYANKGEPDKAINDLDYTLRLSPDNADVYAYRGMVNGQLKHFEKSVADFKKAIELNEKLVSAYAGLATIRATCIDPSIRDGAEAVRAATKACELTNWKDSQNLDVLATAYAESGNSDKAVEYEKQAIRIGASTAERQNRMILRLTLFEHGLKFQDPTIFQ